MANERRRVTSADVARASGVSRATVSYVLNNHPRQRIPAETRERVLQAAHDLGYRPSAAARMLRSGASQLVLGVVQFEQVDPGIAAMLKTLETHLAARGFTFIVYVGTSSAQQHPVANLAPAVVISFVNENDPAIAAFLAHFRVPILSMSSALSRQAVGRAQVAYLVQRGKRRIAYALSDRHDVQWLAQARLEGVADACTAHGLEPPIVQVVPLSRAGAQRALRQLWDNNSSPLGICCYNDEIAIALIAALADGGIAVPNSVAVIGCDDIPLAQFSIPPLTTIGFDDAHLLDSLVAQVVASVRNEPAESIGSPILRLVARGSA